MKPCRRERRRARATRALAPLLLLAACSATAGAAARAATDIAQLATGFAQPPQAARPHVTWHWANGNVAAQGVERDLAWLADSGVGGVHTTDIGLSIGQFTAQRQQRLSPGWTRALRRARELTRERGMDLGIFSSAGWSLSGANWVQPQQAMKKLVWSRTRLRGGRRYTGTLPRPPALAGPLQSIPRRHGWLVPDGADHAAPPYYRDAAVVAYPAAAGSGEPLTPARISSNFLDGAMTELADNDTATHLTVDPPSSVRRKWIQYEFAAPVSVSAVSVSLGPPGSAVNVRYSDDGRSFTMLDRLVLGAAGQTTQAVTAVTARFFRFYIAHHRAAPTWGDRAPGASTDTLQELLAGDAQQQLLILRDLTLWPRPRVHRFEQKAGFDLAQDYGALSLPQEKASASGVPATQVIDLSDRLGEDGSLDWEIPPGEWEVLRLGYSLTGAVNHAAPAGATGLEVDKLDAGHVRNYLQRYLGEYRRTAEGSARTDLPIDALFVDSYEVGAQNGSEQLLAEFARRRGYDPTPWLPALTGVVVQDSASSDRFLWDFRRTIGESLCDNHYATLASVAREHDLTLYSEGFEHGRPALGDDLDCRRFADVPSAALWTFTPGAAAPDNYVADILGAASVAHFYAREQVAVELFTSALSPWAHSPRTLQPVADLAFALGMTRPLIHTSVHQPLDAPGPGLSLSIFGQDFNRHASWAPLATSWTDYLARTAYLLQQGTNVTDIALFYGQDAPPVTLGAARLSAPLPPGYEFDLVSAAALLNDLEYAGGLLRSPGGATYRALLLGGHSRLLTLPVLRKLQRLVTAGALVIGTRPEGSPSLADDAQEVAALIAALWGDEPARGTDSPAARRVWPLARASEALAAAGITPDLRYPGDDGAAPLLFQHRKLATADIYFLSNQSDSAQDIELSFRAHGRPAQLWQAIDASVAALPTRTLGQRTLARVRFAPLQSLFVVFGDFASQPASRSQAPAQPRYHLDAGWSLSLQSPGSDTQQPVATDGSLRPWNAFDEPQVRYHAGTGNYRNSADIPAQQLDGGSRFYLDLGAVGELAAVSVNGVSLGVLWRPPYRLDITDALRPGRNNLEVRVSNLWVNRAIGAARGALDGDFVTNSAGYRADATLLPSGLLGPVTIEVTPAPDPH